MRLTVASIEGLKLHTGVADKIIFDDLRHSRARQRSSYVDLSVQDWRKDPPACPRTGHGD